jgi:bifunctional enzyme CysN/CysC
MPDLRPESAPVGPPGPVDPAGRPDKAARAAAKGQRPALVWLTGLPGAGKTTIATALERELRRLGHHTYVLDGDVLRTGLNRDLGFTDADRVENIRRVAEVAALMVDAGLIVIASFISPFEHERAYARSRVEPGEFLEVFVDTPLAVAEERDPKGMYKRARRGELANFTGVDSRYEAPTAPDVRIETTATSPEAAAQLVIAALRRRAGAPPAPAG